MFWQFGAALIFLKYSLKIQKKQFLTWSLNNLISLMFPYYYEISLTFDMLYYTCGGWLLLGESLNYFSSLVRFDFFVY